MRKYLLLLIAVLWGQGACAELVVVVSPGTKVHSLTRSQITRIFLGETGILPDGSPVVPLDVIGERNRFYIDILKKAPEQIGKYWARMIFTGKAEMPRQVPGSEVKPAMRETPGVISYMERAAVDGSVKIVPIEED